MHERASSRHGLWSFVWALAFVFFMLLRDHGPRHFMLQNWSKTCKKRSTSKIYVQMRKRPINEPRLGWLVILILNSCHYQS